MKFNIKQSILVDLLQKISGPTTTKQNLAASGNVLIATKGNKLRFTTTDLDITIIAYQEATILEEGVVVTPMKRLLSIIRELPNNEVVVERSKNNLLITCEKIEFKINTINPEEFPRIEEKKRTLLIKIDPQELTEMIQLTSFCVGYEDTNYVLGGVFFELFENNIKLVSTDGKRLAFIKRNLPHNQTEIKTKISFILPLKAITEIQKLIKDKEDDVFLFVEENRVGFDLRNSQFIARPIEGEFPKYSQYIPNENNDKLTINRKNFLLGLRRAALLSTPDYQGVKLEIKKESMVISKQTPQLGEIKEVVGVAYTGSPLQIGFNPAYLIDVLKNLTNEEVCFEFFGPDKPGVLRSEGYIYLTLPIKI